MANSILILSFFMTFSCFSGFLISPATSLSSNQTDLRSLLALKSNLKDSEGALSSWKETTHFCNWTGIRCSRRHPDRVVRINLRSRSFVGSLSPHIGNLSFLRFINLQNNTLHGSIPEEIGRLRRLEFVEFSSNSLSGHIPRNLSQCRNLAYLNLIDNNLSGSIPEEIGSLYRLESLGLGANTLAGPIPSFIGNLTSLRQLGLGSCVSQGVIPESFARLKKLLYLFASGNNLTGSIPSGLFNISTLLILGLNSNQLQGSIPSTIGLTLPNLRILHLAYNQFTGSVPVSLSNATSLLEVMFLANHFTGPMPRVGKLSLLKQFGSAMNPIRDDISFISSFTNCTSLRRLEVGHNLLTGSLPATTANLSRHLASFVIAGTDIRGSIPSGIGNLVGLTRFSLHNNDLEGPIPSGIGRLTNLQRLNLGGNRFTNELPSSFGSLTLLNEFYLDRNNFSGTIPKSLSNCTKLLDLDLSHNNLSGPIPREIMSSLSSIAISFDLSYNGLTDTIPLEVGSLTNLGDLDLSDNRLSGVIPNSLRTCKSLVRLRLEGNLLEGQIPSELGSLMGLQELDLSRNLLSGLIPSSFGELSLTRLNFSFNRLQGEAPILGVFRNSSAVSLEGNSGLCGGIPELKLPPCTSSTKNVSALLKILIPTCSIVVAVFLGFIIYLYKRRTARKHLTSQPSFIDTQFMRLSYADLVKATGGFSESNLLGVGRFGSVYRGILDDGKKSVAVKVLNLFVRGAAKSFMAECSALRGIRHRNLVKILSVCESIDFQGNDFKALVYEFKANGSLEKWLCHNQKEEDEEEEEEEEEERGEETSRNQLSMIERLNIAIDIAQALEYLHCGTDSTIVHGDLKPSNILLDHEMTACVGDFGLAKIVSNIVLSHESSSSIGIRGTLGYVPPEYGTSYSVSTEGDVYSYGILLLEMFTNKRPTDDSFKDDVNLHCFVNAALPDHVIEIVDPLLLKGPYMRNIQMIKIKDCMNSILSIGVSCSKEMPKDRMSMTEVVNELHKIQKLLSS